MKINKVIHGYCFGDLGINNIFVTTDENYEECIDKHYLYILNGKYYSIPILPYIVKIGDFGCNSKDESDREQFEDMVTLIKSIKHNLPHHREENFNSLYDAIRYRDITIFDQILEFRDEEDEKPIFEESFGLDDLDDIDSFVSIFGMEAQ